MAETEVLDPVAPPIETPPVAPLAPADPFTLDEARVASLGPEQRAALDPIIDDWHKRANEEITKRETAVTEKYKPFQEKASTFEKLTKYQPFVQWWQEQQKVAAGQNPGQTGAISGTKPGDFASSQEWQEALYEAAQGDGKKLQGIQARMMAAWATPFMQQMTQKQQMIETQMEMKDLFERHSDAKDLDEIGIDSKTKEGISLLEMGLDWAEKNGKPLEEGYQLARRWADQMTVSSQQKAMGLVQGKKDSVTAGNSTSSASGSTVVEVETYDELLKKSLEAEMAGNKNIRFVVRKSQR